MASFFQPGQDDPTIEECGSLKVYCNSIVPAGQRFVHLYQLVTFSLGATATVVPVVLYLVYFLIKLSKSQRPKTLTKKKLSSNASDVTLTNAPPMHSFRPTKSFTLLSGSESSLSVHRNNTRSYDLVVLPLYMKGNVAGEDGDSRSSVCSKEQVTAKMSLASVDMDSFGSDALDDSQVEETADFLAGTCSRNGLTGLALQVSTAKKPEQMDGLIERLYRARIPVLLLCNHDSKALDSISLTYASGLILENACILPNGERRDYFKAQRFREIVSRCHMEREERPNFFIGFLDRWEKEPHPATIRRAVKLAEHFGAVIEHGPINANMSKEPVVGATETLSGFEYIRRGETIGLQKSWVSETRKVWIPNGSSTKLAALSLSALDAVIPQASELLAHHSVPPAQDREAVFHSSTDYIDLAPTRPDFWESSGDGSGLSPLGCYPLTSEPLADHYRAVVETQDHLRVLGMLHAVEGTEEQNLVTALSALAKLDGCGSAVHDLVKGLVNRQVRVYKGMDTGFGLPDSDAHFWGVSKAPEGPGENRVDVYLSQKAPSDAATLLHTWLAHDGVPREQRFEQELLLEVATDQADTSGIPLSIRSAIEQATYSEGLGLLQKLRVSRMTHAMGDAIKLHCWSVLVDETTKAAWNLTAAKAAIDGSTSIRDLLKMRLDNYIRQGATQLPTLDNLVALFEAMRDTMLKALLYGQRDTLNDLTQMLLQAYDPWKSWSDCEYVDVNAELTTLIYFTVLRRAAFEEVYNESTDRCPMFVSQPDQAAVFSELWILGSQCEIYFGLLPRDLGSIVYERYRKHLDANPPTAADRRENEIMTMYFTPDESHVVKQADPGLPGSAMTRTPHETFQLWKKRFAEAGAMSIFCVPAIVDVVLLTFVGRGFFMTAFMDYKVLETAGYALLIALLLTAGVTGWVGSTGNWYLAHYAYDSMIYFHVQRLSGGFVLTLVISAVGLVMFTLRHGVGIGFVFVAYLVAVSTHFNLLGILSAMHQNKAPLTSGRTVLLQNMPILLLSPLITSFMNGHDLVVYLPVMYVYLIATLVRYRALCRQWSGWMDNIPDFTQRDVLEWYSARLDPETSEDDVKEQEALAIETFAEVLLSYQRRTRDAHSSGVFNDPLVTRIARGMPYIDWLFKKTNPTGTPPQLFSTAYFTQLQESKNAQRGLVRGLKDHNVFTLFRLARHDVGQTLALFLVALMDRWVMIVWSAAGPYPSIYSDSRARYGVCLCIIYFCASAMLLDSTLYKYWGLRDKVSQEKLRDFDHAQRIASDFEAFRRASILKAVTDIMSKLLIVFGITTLLLWVFVDGLETTILYYMYFVGYTATLIFQFNRCFTTNVTTHIALVFSAAFVGFVTGCVLHAVPATSQFLYNDVIAQNTAAVLAAAGTSLYTWKDWTAPAKLVSGPIEKEDNISIQGRFAAEESNAKVPTVAMRKSFSGAKVWSDDGKATSKKVTELLRLSLEDPNELMLKTSWAVELVRTARDMWADRKLTVKIVSREDFAREGLNDICSFASQEGTALQLTVGFMAEAELSLPAWQPLLATVVSEAILFHVARSQFAFSESRALHAEHLLHDSDALSRRIEFELSFESPQCLARLALKTEMRLMKHLCLGVDVDSRWETTNQTAREAILRRIAGEPVALTDEFTQWAAESGIDVDTEDFLVGVTLSIHQKCLERRSQIALFGHEQDSLPPPPAQLKPVSIPRTRKTLTVLQSIWQKLISVPFDFVKWTAIVTGGAPNVERELVYCLRKVPMRGVLVWLFLSVWNACRVVKNAWVYWILIYHRPALVNIERLATKGSRRKIVRNTVIVELPRKTITGFAAVNENKTMTLSVYAGSLKEAPETKPLFVDTYDEQLRLKSREDGGDGGVCTYQYESESRWPATKVVAKDKDSRSVGYYDKYGRIIRGTWIMGDDEYVFQYHYKAKTSDILRADYKLAAPGCDDMLSVFWGQPVDPEVYSWVPSKNIGRIVKLDSKAGKTYTCEYEYLHRRDPAISAFVHEANGVRTAVAKAPELFPREADLLSRPKNLSFDTDDLLIYHSVLQVKQMRRYAGSVPTLVSSLNPVSWIVLWNQRRYSRVPTWRIRTELWGHWLKSGSVDAVTACWMDELILREERLLRPYWRARDSGRLDEARRLLDANIEQITAAMDMETDVSEVTVLAIKTADLYAMGLGGDATEVTARPQDCFADTHNRISVIFNDVGCWPVAPGGVSNCRKDLVNGHSTIRNHVLSECANDYQNPRFQIEKSVQSLKLLPLWGIDGGTASHGLLTNLLESEVDEKVADTDVQRDIVGVFVPLLMQFVKGARSKCLSPRDLVEYSNVVLSMAKYYEHKDYAFTWQSKEVEEAWIAAWMTGYQDDSNVRDPAECFEIERPSVPDFRDALGIFKAYFFIFAVKVPEECPKVFQSTHHGISSLFGAILKHRRGANFGIWDHAILWRECCLNISAAQSELPLSVQSMILSGIGLASRLAYFHADVITPCASLFNPMWEVEIGTDKGTAGSRNRFRRKIDPIVNGISNMSAFTPVDQIRTDKPTVLMLSNIQTIKGVKSAIQAADIIINRFGFTDYQLVIYGAKDRQPAYALEMEKFIVDHNLGGKVVLAGFGNPKEVLKDAWLFMNSSISEGLPLAIGEAALAGVPIVATEVGATALVLTDTENPDRRYGEVVPPNDPLALARAQIGILSMVGPWTAFTDEAGDKSAPSLPDDITSGDVEWLTKRFYAKAEHRRQLGMLSRQVVLSSFHGERYLREHQQMFWVQWHQARLKADERLRAQTYRRFKFGAPAPLRYSEEDDEVAKTDDAASEKEGAQPIALEQWRSRDVDGKDKSKRRSRLVKKRPSTLTAACVRTREMGKDSPV